MKVTDVLTDAVKVEKTQHAWAGAVLLSGFVVLLGWYFLASYLEHGRSPKIQEKLLTIHDDLLGIAGHPDGNAIAVGKFGLILLSNDGGKTWQRRPSETSQPLSAVSFADRNHGFVVGSGGALLATTDGGVTWRAQNSGTKDQLLGVFALSTTRAFAVGAFGTLLSTSDGGRSWARHELKWETLVEKLVKEGGLVEPNLNAVYFDSPESGWIVGEFGLVLHSKDGGQTWSSQRYGSDLPQLYATKFMDGNRGWAMGQAGTLIQTTDAGQRWSSVEVTPKRDLYGIALEGERGIIVGDRVVLISRDGGASWQSMDSRPPEQWLSGVVLKNNQAIAVGGAGTTQILTVNRTGSEMEKKVP